MNIIIKVTILIGSLIMTVACQQKEYDVVPLSYTEQVSFYQEKAKLGDGRALFELSKLYSLGMGVEKNKFESMKLLKASAAKNYWDAHMALYRAYKNGQQGPYGTAVIEKDLALSEKFKNLAISELKNAAESDDPIALYNLGRHYENGRLGLDTDLVKAGKLYNKAIEEFKQQAEAGNAEAQMYLGAFYKRGKAFLVEDKVVARNWFEKAVASQYPGSYTSVVSTLDDDKSVLAIDILRKGAELGDYAAQEKLGFILDDTDIKAATNWFEQARKQKRFNTLTSTIANNYLEMKDYDKAVEWFFLAATEDDNKYRIDGAFWSLHRTLLTRAGLYEDNVPRDLMKQRQSEVYSSQQYKAFIRHLKTFAENCKEASDPECRSQNLLEQISH